MDHCTELCTKDAIGSCSLCVALAERDRFERRWFKGGLFIDGAHAMQRRGVFTFLHRYAFPLCFLVLGGLLHLWFAWRATGPNFAPDNPVFVVVLVISLGVPLLWLLLWWLPQWQVTAVPEEKDRIDLETKSRQTMCPNTRWSCAPRRSLFHGTDPTDLSRRPPGQPGDITGQPTDVTDHARGTNY